MLCFGIYVQKFLGFYSIEGAFCNPDIKRTVISTTYKNKGDFLSDFKTFSNLKY